MLRYVERNAKRANVVNKAEQWQWSSVWRRETGTTEQKKLLSAWPTAMPSDYLKILNQPLTTAEEEALERSEEKSIPYGSDTWVDRTVKKYGIEQVLKGGGETEKWWLTPFS